MQVELQVLRQLVSAGYLACREHPFDPLLIWNYSNRCTFDKFWTPETMMCRGLITDLDGVVVARPFRKFFNADEHLAAGRALPTEPFDVFEKMDGSLGIMYPTSRGPMISTRGSFTSPQAHWATAWLRRHIAPRHLRLANAVAGNLTFLFEIVAPWNRIVVQYPWQGLVLLTAAYPDEKEIDLQSAAGVLSSWLARNDSGEYEAHNEGLEDLPCLSLGGGGSRFEKASEEAAREREELELEEQSESVGVQTSALRENSSGDRDGESGQAVRGLRRDVHVGGDGLRSCSGCEAFQYWSSEEPRSTGGGDREVRTRVRELPSSEDRESSAPFRIVKKYSGYGDFDAVMSIKGVQTQNFEGFVVRFAGGLRLKVKLDEYVRLHRLLTGVTPRRVWEVLSAGGSLDSMLSAVPEEFEQWVRKVAGSLQDQYDAVLRDARRTRAAVPVGVARREQAEFILKNAVHPSLVFTLLDGKSPDAAAWKIVYPPGAAAFRLDSDA